MGFEHLGLCDSIVRAADKAGYETPTPIQTKSIPPILEGRDMLGCAQTGTGKTAAFAMPILHTLSSTEASGKTKRSRRPIRALVLSPTRELAAQIGDSFRVYGKRTKIRQTVVFGGVSQHPQTKALQAGVDVLVATPGRLLDLIQQGFIDLGWVEILVLDEADHMFDMGFLPDVRRIIRKTPSERQTLLFSATMPRDIRDLANSTLTDPVSISIKPQKQTAELIKQSVYHVTQAKKVQLLATILKSQPDGTTLIFTRTKHGADAVVRKLSRTGIHAEAIHGNKSQNKRQRTLDNFKSGKVQVLVATDIAARGIDVSGISYVINYDMPSTPETYVHRIGRTGRAGDAGIAITFCNADQRRDLKAIEKLIGQAIPAGSRLPKMPAEEVTPAPRHVDRKYEQSEGPARRGNPKKKSSRKKTRYRDSSEPRSSGGSSNRDGAKKKVAKKKKKTVRKGEGDSLDSSSVAPAKKKKYAKKRVRSRAKPHHKRKPSKKKS